MTKTKTKTGKISNKISPLDSLLDSSTTFDVQTGPYSKIGI